MAWQLFKLNRKLEPVIKETKVYYKYKNFGKALRKKYDDSKCFIRKHQWQEFQIHL